MVVNLLSLVQIVLESFPVSSSGNVLVFKQFLLQSIFQLPVPELPEGFWFLLHGPTILVVGIFYFKTWFSYLTQLLKGDKQVLPLVLFGLVTDTLTVLVYGIASWFAVDLSWPVWIGFGLTSLLLFSLLALKNSKKNEGTFELQPFKQGVAVGCAQSAALLIPGLSRMAATYVAGRWAGIPALKALEYSLLVQFPLLVAGFLKSGWWLVKHPEHANVLFDSCFVIVIYGSAVLAYAGLCCVQWCVKHEKMWLFGIYTAVLSFCVRVCEIM